MTISNCIDFANEVKLCFLSTVDRGQPRVRALAFWFADETGFYFQTGNMRSFYEQLKENPYTEACFHKQVSNDNPGIMLRVSGKVEFLNDKRLKEKVLNERPFLKQFGFTPESPELVVFRLAHGEAHFWTMEKNLSPKEVIIF